MAAQPWRTATVANRGAHRPNLGAKNHHTSCDSLYHVCQTNRQACLLSPRSSGTAAQSRAVKSFLPVQRYHWQMNPLHMASKSLPRRPANPTTAAPANPRARVCPAAWQIRGQKILGQRCSHVLPPPHRLANRLPSSSANPVRMFCPLPFSRLQVRLLKPQVAFSTAITATSNASRSSPSCRSNF